MRPNSPYSSNMNQPAKKVTREELYEAVWSRTLTTLACEWNTTYLRLVQACDEMEVPRPSQGYWQLIALREQVAKEPLPERKDHVPNEWVLLPHGVRQEKTEQRRTVAVEIVAQKEKDGSEVIERQRLEEKVPPTSVPITTGQEPDLRKATERAVLDMIRQAVKIDFWVDKISEGVYPVGLSRWLGMDGAVKVPEGRLLSAVKNTRKEYRCFQVRVEETKERYDQLDLRLMIQIRLREGHEWKDAWEEAWTFVDKPNPHCLSDNALRLWVWAKGAKNTGKMTDRRKIGAQAKLRKTYNHMEDHLREVRLKADSTIQWETDQRLWHGQMRIWFQKEVKLVYDHGPLNPALGLDIREIGHAGLERFKIWLNDEILKPGFPQGTERVGIFDIADRRTLKRAFIRLPDNCGRYGYLPDFFETVRVINGAEIRYRFEDGGGPWLVICQPQSGVTWKEIKERLVAKAKEIPLEKKYPLSGDSRALLQWILDLRSDEYLMGMTPPLEEHLKVDIGIETEFEDANVRTYLELLLEEINENTDFYLRPISWHHYNRELTRVLLKKRETDLERVVHAVQVFGLSKNRVLDGDKVREVISGLIGESQAPRMQSGAPTDLR